jgi:hypothetical protein
LRYHFIWLIAGREIGSNALQALHAGIAMVLAAASLLLASRAHGNESCSQTAPVRMKRQNHLIELREET